MNPFRHFRDAVVAMVGELGLPEGLDTSRLTAEPPRQAAHGDITINAAMILAKPAGRKPRELAQRLARHLEGLDDVAGAEIAGPGFINLRLVDSFWHRQLVHILAAGPAYGDSDIGGGAAVNVEYVSANPTGPLHVGHGRGAVVGDALAALLEKAGYRVTREYWINDSGAQVDKLAFATYWRYLEALGDQISEEVITGFLRDTPLEYKGEYLIPVGKALAEEYGEKFVEAAIDDWLPTVRKFAIDAMLELIKNDLKALGVAQEVFTSERRLVESGGVDAALEVLEDRGLIYVGVLKPPKGRKPEDWEPRPQTLFKASDFGDDVDRPLRKSDGSWTYFATDVAYHLDKYRRGCPTLIDVWGADHGGYVKRVQAVTKALTDGKGELDVKLCQMVNLLEDGVPVKMSKRAGTFVTLREVIDKVGRDVVRFIMLTRRNDARLDFDLVKVTEQSRDNPVFYVQYAHARIRSVLRHAVELDFDPQALPGARLERLTDPAELALIKVMAGWPQMVESAAQAHEPHRVAYYLHDLAGQFHMLWNKGNDDASLRFIVADDRDLTAARLALVQGAGMVIASGLKVLGITPVEEMR